MDTPHRAPVADIAADMTDRSRTRRTAAPTALGGECHDQHRGASDGDGGSVESEVRCERSCSEYGERRSASTVRRWGPSGLAWSSWSGLPTPTPVRRQRNWPE